MCESPKPLYVQDWEASVSPVLPGHADEQTKYCSGQVPLESVVALPVWVPDIPRSFREPIVIVSAILTPPCWYALPYWSRNWSVTIRDHPACLVPQTAAPWDLVATTATDVGRNPGVLQCNVVNQEWDSGSSSGNARARAAVRRPPGPPPAKSPAIALASTSHSRTAPNRQYSGDPPPGLRAHPKTRGALPECFPPVCPWQPAPPVSCECRISIAEIVRPRPR
jgi:hypothetical protein